MALLFMDSFDHYATADITEKWTSQSTYDRTIASGGRNGTNCLKFTGAGWVSITCLGGVTEAIVGAAIKVTSFSGGCAVVEFGSASTWECGLRVLADGTLQPFVVTNAQHEAGFNTNTALVGSPSGVALQGGVWAYLEVKMKCDESTGTCIVRKDGIEILNLTGLDTLFSSAVLTRVGLGCYNGNLNAFDDLVVMDTTGARNNAFLGDVTIGCLYPDADGNSHAWVLSTGTPDNNEDYLCIDEALVNDDTDYISTNVLNAKSTFSMEDVAAGANIKAIQIVSAVRKGAEGPGKIKHVVRSNSTDYDLTEQGIGGTSYAFLRSIVEVDPATSAAWDEAGFNAVEIGVKKTG